MLRGHSAAVLELEGQCDCCPAAAARQQKDKALCYLFLKSDKYCVLLSAFSLRWKEPSPQLAGTFIPNCQGHSTAWRGPGSPRLAAGRSPCCDRVAGDPHPLLGHICEESCDPELSSCTTACSSGLWSCANGSSARECRTG